MAVTAAKAMAPGRQAPDHPLGSTHSAASRVPSAPRLRLPALRDGADWAARLAGCGRVATAKAEASEAVAVARRGAARRGSRGGSSSGGCTGGGGQGSKHHTLTHSQGAEPGQLEAATWSRHVIILGSGRG